MNSFAGFKALLSGGFGHQLGGFGKGIVLEVSLEPAAAIRPQQEVYSPRWLSNSSDADASNSESNLTIRVTAAVTSSFE